MRASTTPQQLFENEDELLGFLKTQTGGRIGKLRSSNPRKGKYTRLEFYCRGGMTDDQSSPRMKTPCPFRAVAVCHADSGRRWRLTVTENHDHGPDAPHKAKTIRSDNISRASRRGVVEEHSGDAVSHLKNLEVRLKSAEERLKNTEERLKDAEERLARLEDTQELVAPAEECPNHTKAHEGQLGRLEGARPAHASGGELCDVDRGLDDVERALLADSNMF